MSHIARVRIDDKTLTCEHEAPEASRLVQSGRPAVFAFEGVRGSVLRSSRRQLVIEWNGHGWVGEVRRRAGVRLVRESGEPVALVGPFRIKVESDVSDEDVAVALVLALYELDVNIGPIWLHLAQASVLPLGWPKPIPGRRWSRRTS